MPFRLHRFEALREGFAEAIDHGLLPERGFRTGEDGRCCPCSATTCRASGERRSDGASAFADSALRIRLSSGRTGGIEDVYEVWNVCKAALDTEIKLRIAEADIAAAAPRFANVYCSSCGQKFGAANEGFSHCSDHIRRRAIDG
ncbi:hypothetical protein [Burkholderia dolosa]|uniref:hypothetical protein n=1 Tax=Burkholderia dolosa TaxID=152500 RepID=UPI0021BC0B7A|nr:hypothetical protein [Burkholderia dolosa]